MNMRSYLLDKSVIYNIVYLFKTWLVLIYIYVKYQTDFELCLLLFFFVRNKTGVGINTEKTKVIELRSSHQINSTHSTARSSSQL